MTSTKTEGSLQRYFKRLAKENGILWRKIKFEGQRGCPDVLVAKGGVIILIELKSPTHKGRLSELQKRQIKYLTDAGIDTRVIDTEEGIADVIRELTK